MRSLLVVLALVAVVLAETTCKDNCLSRSCDTCYCGTTIAMRDANSICSKYTGWNIEECICALKVASGGNANAVSSNTDGSAEVGLFMINSALWPTCSNGVAPCSPETNLQCAVEMYKSGGNSFSLFTGAIACLPFATTTHNSSNSTSTTKHPTSTTSHSGVVAAAATAATHAATAATHAVSTHAAATSAAHSSAATHAAATHASAATQAAATPHAAATHASSASSQTSASSQSTSSGQTTYGSGFGMSPFKGAKEGGNGKIGTFKKGTKKDADIEVEITKLLVKGTHSFHADEKNIKKFEF